MNRLPAIMSVLVAVALAGASLPPDRGIPHVRAVRAQSNATLVLNPDAGPAPQVNGSFSGIGWCSGGTPTVTSVPPGLASGSGTTVDGVLSGSFTVNGQPGQVVTINVSAVCRVGTTEARANFRFDDPTAVPRPTEPLPTDTPTLAAIATETPTPTKAPTSTATATPTRTATLVVTSTIAATATATATRPAAPTAAAPATSTATAVASPSPAPTAPNGTVRVMGCTPSPDELSIRMTYAGGAHPPPAFVDLSLPAVQAPSPGLFSFVLPPGAPPGTFFEVAAQVTDPDCASANTTSVFWDPAVAEIGTLWLPTGKSSLEASSHGPQMPAGDIITWVTTREFKGEISGLLQLFRLNSTSKFDNVAWQVSLQPFAGAFDPLDPEPAGILGQGVASCIGPAECTFLVDFDDFLPVELQASPTATAAWSTQMVGSLFEASALFELAQSVAQSSPTGTSPPAVNSKGSPSWDVGGQLSGTTLLAALYAPPREFYFRALPMLGGTALGPPSNTVILRWQGPYDGPDLKNVKITDCSNSPEEPACKWKTLKPNSYKVEILTYHGWISPVAGHAGCFVVTETTVASISPLFPATTYTEGQVLCPPKPKEPGLLESIVNFVIDAVNWVANTYAYLKESVITFIANFVPEALCDKSCVGILLDAALASLGIPPSIPNFDQLMNEGIDYLAATAAEQIGVPKAIQDMAEGPAKDLATKQFKDTVKQQIKDGITAGLEEMQHNLASKVPWIPNGVPVKPDPLGEYQPPAMTLRVTRKPAGDICTGVFLISGNVTNTTPQGIEELGGKSETWLYEPRYVDVPELAEGEAVTIPVTLKPRFSYGFAGAKYWSYDHAAAGWWKLYSGGMLTLSTGGGSCVGGGDTKTLPADGALLGAQVSP